MQVFRAYTFDADENSFCVLMLQSYYTRFQTTMTWSLWNHYTFAMMSGIFKMPAQHACVASTRGVVKTYRNTSTSELLISVRREQVDAEVEISSSLSLSPVATRDKYANAKN